MTNRSEVIRMVQYFSRRLLPLAAAIGLLIALLGPLTYWIIEHRNLDRLTNLHARELAEDLQGLALDSPTLWKYQSYKFNSLLERFHPTVEVLGFNVLDENGAPISGYEYKRGWGKPGRGLTFTEDLTVTLGTAPIIFNNRRIGSVELLVSDALLLRACTILFCLSSLLGTVLALLVYQFPVRVVKKMSGEIEGLLSTLKQSEERYRTLVEMSLVGVYIIVDGIFRYVNPKLSEIFGWSIEELIEKKGPVDLTLPEDWPTVEENLGKRFSGELLSINYEFRGVTKDKRVIFLEVYGGRITYQGQPAMIGTLLDISKRKRAEEQVRILNEELELKVEEKTRELLDAQEELVRKEKLATLGQLSGSVGHELRNPLGVMSNAVYFLKMVLPEADETTKEYLDIIKQEIENSQRIITDLLDFARTKSPRAESVRTTELVAQSIGKCTIPGCVTLLEEIPETLPQLKVDPHQMGQVLQNLITNAIQAMPDGGALRVAAQRVRSEESGERNTNEVASPLTPYPSQDFVEISIADTGEGISEENMEKIFQPLFTTKAKGIGLGLVVCRNLVEANCGQINVASRSGEGTTFTVMLPVEQGET